MQHDEFIGQVQARAHLHSRGAAEAGTRATLETLAERIPAPMAEKLAAQLPTELGEHLRRVEYAPDEPNTGVRMDRHEFFDRVARRARTDPPKAVHEARTVVELLEEATQGAVTERIRQSLDEETASILFSGSTGTAGG
ncbi:DUF2267 domain-containing protein [Streptomyces albus subsp. chlorinus]|uniref:DUF2267 domain-containing protein n=1 Tax=Streptomyces albus TaxID=1888 RepID=UPI00156E48ED|nr:DUF2267 domain-containing protein [Streptomyces albus]NSC24937.1 DUF2267 domain-containing protein [Streptomyces albus subsp. chlorinus]